MFLDPGEGPGRWLSMGSSQGCQGTIVSWGKGSPEQRQWEGQHSIEMGQSQGTYRASGSEECRSLYFLIWENRPHVTPSVDPCRIVMGPKARLTPRQTRSPLQGLARTGGQRTYKEPVPWLHNAFQTMLALTCVSSSYHFHFCQSKVSEQLFDDYLLFEWKSLWRQEPQLCPQKLTVPGPQEWIFTEWMKTWMNGRRTLSAGPRAWGRIPDTGKACIATKVLLGRGKSLWGA